MKERFDQWEQPDSFKQLRKYSGLILRRWYFVLASLLIALFVGWFINRYETPDARECRGVRADKD